MGFRHFRHVAYLCMCHVDIGRVSSCGQKCIHRDRMGHQLPQVSQSEREREEKKQMH